MIIIITERINVKENLCFAFYSDIILISSLCAGAGPPWRWVRKCICWVMRMCVGKYGLSIREPNTETAAVQKSRTPLLLTVRRRDL